MTSMKALLKTGRQRRWLTWGGLLLVLALAWPAWRECDRSLRSRRGFNALSNGNYGQAVEVLESAAAAYPNDAQLAFWAAIAHRRNNNLEKFEMALARAERLAYSPDEIRLQRVLAWTQHGLASEENAAELRNRCLQGADDFTADQIYEAQVKGFMSLFQLAEALQALDHWIAWKPKASVPRLLRAQINEQLDMTQRAEEDYLAVVQAEPDNVSVRISYARFLLLAQKHEEARVQFEKCEKYLPDDPGLILGMAELELRTGGDLQKVERQLQGLLASSPDDKVQRQALVHLSNLYVTRKQYDKAIALLEAPAVRDQLDIPTYQALSRAYSGLGQRDKAQHYRELSRKERDRRFEISRINGRIIRDPKNPELRFRQAQNHWEMGKKEAALTWWYTAVLAEPLHQASHEALAEYYADRGDADRATYHTQLAELSVERTFLLAWQAYTNNDFELVREKQAAIARYPSYKHYVELLDYGLEVKEKQREFDPAHLQSLQRLSQFPRLRSKAMTVLGSALLQLSQGGPAEQALTEVIHNDPKEIEAHRWLTVLNFDIRALERCAYHCDQVAQLDPDDYRPHRLMGAMGKMLQSFEAAIASYQEALRRNPGERVRQEILLEMADCQLRVLKAEEALKTIELAQESLLANLLRARGYLATGQTSDAKKLLEQVLQEHPDEWMAHGLRGDVAIAEKDFPVAVRHLEQLVAARPFDDSGWVKLSQAYTRMNDRKKAEEALDKAKRIRPTQAEYAELINLAVSDPDNLEIRLKMASLARQLGQEDLALEWDRAVELLKSKAALQAPASPNASPLVIPGGSAPASRSAEAQKTQVTSGTECGQEPQEEFSGPQPGEALPSFSLRGILGPQAEKEFDPVAQASGKPLLLIFVHEVNRPSVGLARLLGDYAARRAKDGLHCGVVFLTDEPTETETWMKRASAALPKEVAIGISGDGQEGPGDYGLNRKMTMTILVADKGKVTANFALVQPSIQADAPKVLQAIVDVVGGKAPALAELGFGAKAPPQRPQPRKAKKQDD